MLGTSKPNFGRWRPPVLGQDGGGHAQVHTLRQRQRYEYGRDAARLQGSGDEHVGVVNHSHGQDT